MNFAADGDDQDRQEQRGRDGHGRSPSVE